MIYINRFLDSEEINNTKFEQFIITNTNCKDLIDDITAIWEELYCYDSIKDLLADTDLELTIADTTKKLLAKYEDYDRDCFGSSYELIYDILDENNLLVKDYKILNFKY